jgi:hypothetical protein
MTDNPLDFLDETLDDQPQVEVEEAQAPEPEQAEPKSTGEIAEPPSAPEKETKEVPFVALMDEREKRQAAQRELEEIRKKMAEYERNAQQPQQKPDFFENPEAVVQQHVNAVKLQQSKFLAEKEYGADLVAQAYAYFDEHPAESQQLVNHPSPFHAAVEHFQRQKKLAEIGADPDAYINAQVEARLAERLAQSPAPKAPPPSMSKAPSTGGERISPGSAFDELFAG